MAGALRRWLGCGIALAALCGGGSGAMAAETPTPPPAATAPQVARPDTSYYLPMRDGVRVAVSLWFPGGKPPAAKAPVLLIQTRYGRTGIYNFNEGGHYALYRQAGYVVAVLDTRGSTASFGPREVELGPDEVADMDEIIHHLKAQPWSNGQIIAAGLSYMADTADLATGSPAGLTGAIIRQADFDIYRGLMVPGGIWNDAMLEGWGADTLRRDLGRSVDPSLGLDCALRVADCPGLFPRLQPVDADRDFALVRSAIAGRKRWTSATYQGVEFIDDKAGNGHVLAPFSPSTHLPAIRQQRVPVQYWGSWMDAGTADGALTRFNAAPEVPAQVIITANDHGGGQLTDPFLSGENPPNPAGEAQVAAMMDFAAQVRAGQLIGRSIRYYVLGTGEFRESPVWPPKGIAMRQHHLGPGHSLAAAPGDAGFDRYSVDFTASTGPATRWSTQMGTAAAYGDRQAADAKLLTYTSAPFEQDMELAGRASVTLTMKAETADPAIFVYLEDVAQDGRVTYLTEGQLRAVSRKPAAPGDLPYPTDGPAHSHRRADALPVVPGETFEVSIALFPVAARIRKGHAVRIAIAGADAGTFRRYSDGKPDAFTILRGGDNASAVTLPLRVWQ